MAVISAGEVILMDYKKLKESLPEPNPFLYKHGVVGQFFGKDLQKTLVYKADMNSAYYHYLATKPLPIWLLESYDTEEEADKVFQATVGTKSDSAIYYYYFEVFKVSDPDLVPYWFRKTNAKFNVILSNEDIADMASKGVTFEYSIKKAELYHLAHGSFIATLSAKLINSKEMETDLKRKQMIKDKSMIAMLEHLRITNSPILWYVESLVTFDMNKVWDAATSIGYNVSCVMKDSIEFNSPLPFAKIKSDLESIGMNFGTQAGQWKIEVHNK